MSASGVPAVTPDRIMETVWGYAPPMILAAAVNSRVFDVLDSGPKTLEELAKAAGTAVRGLRPILNALAGFQFLTKSADGRFALLSILPHDKPQLWLLDGERGAARQLTAGDGVSAAISPDGSLVAAGALTRANDRLMASYTTESIDGGTTVGSGNGLPIAWLQP